MPFLHVEYTRFITLCDQVKGLNLEAALLQLDWHRKPITQKFRLALEEAIVKAKNKGLDLKNTYIGKKNIKKKCDCYKNMFV